MGGLRQEKQHSRASVSSFYNRRRLCNGRARLIVAAIVIVQVVAVLPLLEGTIHAQVKETTKGGERRTQGGILTFGPEGKVSTDGALFVQTIGLSDYVGQPLKALQLRVISSGGLRLRSVDRGADIRISSEWNLSHVIVHGKAGVDTAKVVIFGLGETSMPPRPYSELLSVTYDVPSSNAAGNTTLSITDALGALRRGENANVIVGPPRGVSLNKNKRK